MAEHDVVIRDGTVVDVTGVDCRSADVAIDGGVITEVCRMPGTAHPGFDADGVPVTSRRVDLHAHHVRGAPAPTASSTR